MKAKLLYVVPIVIAIIFFACDDDEKPKTVPVVTTAAVTDITATTATGGGEISDNGNAEVTASGLAYSSTNTTPTVDDTKTEGTMKDGAFTSNLENLTSGTPYYVRAYATNSVGTGYGEIVEFSTNNTAPTASNVAITGTAEVGKQLTATYTYTDAENNAESGSTFQWYMANDGAGAGEVAITGATALTFTPQDAQELKHIRIGITPKAATGTATGTEVKSAFAGLVAAQTAVIFTYNGVTVTYGIITSSLTAKKWLDRNLGAPNTPTAYNDYANYGDLFQWGRSADGHQLVTRGPDAVTTTGSATTTTLSTSNNPGHGLWILSSADPFDWRSPQNDNLWQGVTGTNNPCPAGFRLPTNAEWVAENLTAIEPAYAQLKLTSSGSRSGATGNFSSTNAGYWSSTVDSLTPTLGGLLLISSSSATATGTSRRTGRSCRCIKN